MPHTTSISDYLKEKQELVDVHLSRLVPDSSLPQKKLFEAMRYSLLSPGKRIRPILALAVAEAFGASFDVAITPACALELIHTYSLIHDDLPCMDDDDFRRGKPSLHKAFSEADAVLAGDCLLTYAFEVLAHAPSLDSSQKIRLISALSRSCGAEGMIGGQMIDIEAEGKTISLESLKLMHRCKTGALITASIECGAIIANAQDSDIQTLRMFGDEIGLAFQIVDDLLEGKQTESDRINQKPTYLSLLGYEKGIEAAHALLTSSLERLESLNKNTAILQEIARYIISRKE